MNLKSEKSNEFMVFFFSQNTLQGLYNVITSLKMLSRGLLIFFSIFKNSFSKFGFLLCQLWWYLYAKVPPKRQKELKQETQSWYLPPPPLGFPHFFSKKSGLTNKKSENYEKIKYPSGSSGYIRNIIFYIPDHFWKKKLRRGSPPPPWGTPPRGGAVWDCAPNYFTIFKCHL